MFESILVVCEGNLCRSPVAAALLGRDLGRGGQLGSAGVAAAVGSEMDPTARAVAAAAGLICPPHRARQLDVELCSRADLILVMEQRQREHILRIAPESTGKTLLFGKWLDEREIPDPFRRSREAYEQVYRILAEAAAAWAERLR
jgi:protein-tyrosine phosphatase